MKTVKSVAHGIPRCGSHRSGLIPSRDVYGKSPYLMGKATNFRLTDWAMASSSQTVTVITSLGSYGVDGPFEVDLAFFNGDFFFVSCIHLYPSVSRIPTACRHFLSARPHLPLQGGFEEVGRQIQRTDQSLGHHKKGELDIAA